MSESKAATSPKAEALRDALTNLDPFCSGVCAVPEHQLWLYYAQGKDFRRIDFANCTTEELEALSQACQPASFGFNNKNVLDETYRKAGRMDPDTFSTSFDPRSLRIHDVIEQDLLFTDQTVELELYKLNVYEKGGFFKAHQDTPRGDNMFGTLVVVFPAPHEGGQLSLRADDSERHWIVDFKEQVTEVKQPFICFVAFFGDIEHQVLPVTSGYRVTLTYNLYFRVKNNMPRAIPGPFYERLKEALIKLVNDPETLPNGGYLGLGLCHQYAYDETKPVDSLLNKLKGSDAALASVCAELGLPCTLRLLYAEDNEAFGMPWFYLLSRVKLSTLEAESSLKGGTGMGYSDDQMADLLSRTVEDITPQDLEGVDIIGCPTKRDDLMPVDSGYEGFDFRFMNKFFKDPASQVLEVKAMSSVLCGSSFVRYGNETSLETFYGTACMIISVKPKESREHLPL